MMITSPNIPEADAFYQALISAHEGLSAQQSLELNTRLVMLLANQVGDQSVLNECITAARRAFDPA